MKRTDFTGFPILVGDSAHDRSDIPMTSVMADLHKSACEKRDVGEGVPAVQGLRPGERLPQDRLQVVALGRLLRGIREKKFILKL